MYMRQRTKMREATVREPARFGTLEATSTVMSEALTQLARLGPTDVTIVLVGESGSGKAMLARAVHETSPRSSGPFVSVDCRAAGADDLESELFGLERLADSRESYAGAFERSDGGTLFLREVGELPLELQPRVLRALESRGARRVGGRSEHAFHPRVVGSSTRDLRGVVAAGQFRQDLYFALSGAIVAVPPLRSRAEDLPRLVESILRTLGRSDVAPSAEVIDRLAQRSWPGNVRELKHSLASALAFVEEGVLEPRHLQLAPTSDTTGELERLPLGGQPLEKLERVAIKQTLAQMRGVKSQTAQALGIAVSTLYEKLKKYGL